MSEGMFAVQTEVVDGTDGVTYRFRPNGSVLMRTVILMVVGLAVLTEMQQPWVSLAWTAGSVLVTAALAWSIALSTTQQGSVRVTQHALLVDLRRGWRHRRHTIPWTSLQRVRRSITRRILTENQPTLVLDILESRPVQIDMGDHDDVDGLYRLITQHQRPAEVIGVPRAVQALRDTAR